MNDQRTPMAPRESIENKYFPISNGGHKSLDTSKCMNGNLACHSSSKYNGFVIAENRTKRRRVTINVSGERYQTYAETLDSFPKTLLGDVERRARYYDEDEKEYFFDRDRNAFAAIIYYYQSQGQFYCPLTVPLHILVCEAKFFDLGQEALNQVLDIQDSENTKLPKNKLQREIWKLFDIPDSGIAANILTIFSVLVIIFSVAILCIETLPYFKGYDQTKTNFPPYSNTAPLTRFMTPNDSRSLPVNNIKESKASKKVTNWKATFDLCETGFVAWFSLEFLVRLFSCPDKIAFAKSCMNIIDLLAIIPFYITLIFHQHGYGLDHIRIIRLVRVFRIFKLSRHSRGLQILGMTLRASIKELGLLIFFLFIGVVLFSSAVYYVEVQSFRSIPDAFWWAIITMCTVGYGDNVPLTYLGKVVGSLCAICGVLTIALPVPVIVSNFDYFYQRERARKFHQAVKAGCCNSQSDSSNRINFCIPKTENFRRQEHIERQKKLKKLEIRHKRQSRSLFQRVFCTSEEAKTEAKKEETIIIERESVV